MSAHRTDKRVAIRQKKVKKVKLADSVRCPEPERVKTEDNSSENMIINAATLNAVSETFNTHADVSSESQQGLVIDTNTNTENEEVYADMCSADNYIEDSTRDSGDTKDSETEADDWKPVHEHDFVVKVEPNWGDSGNEDDNIEDATTMDDASIKEDTTYMGEDNTTTEYTSVVEESTSMRLTNVMEDYSLLGPSTSSGKTDGKY